MRRGLLLAFLLGASGCVLLEPPLELPPLSGSVEANRAALAAGVDLRLERCRAADSLARFRNYESNARKYRFYANPKFWARDVDFSCASPWNDRYGSKRAGTAISPQHVVFANHFPLEPGTRLVFVDARGIMHLRTMLASLRIAETDLRVGLLDQPLPPSIHPASILPDDYAQYLGNGAGLPVVTFDQEEKALVMELFPISTIPEVKGMTARNLKLKQNSKRSEFYEHLIVGDSGNPCFLLVGKEPVLLYTVYSGGPGAGPALQKLRVPLQAAMDKLSSERKYQLKTVSFL